MKKALLSVITFIYLIMSSGIAMEVHYCMDRKAGTDLFSTADHKCGKCGMKEKKGGCCRDEHKLYKLSDDYKGSSIVDFKFNFSPKASTIPALARSSFNTLDKQLSAFGYIPPGSPPRDICIYNSVFLI